MDSYKEDNPEFKKQLLIPLVVLLLCTLALTALGFAYMHASELDIEKNGLDNKYYEIDYMGSDGVAINSKLDAVKIIAYTDIVVDNSTNPATRTFSAHFDNADYTEDFYITIRSDMSADTEFTLNTTVDMGNVLGQFITYDNTDAQTDVVYASAQTDVAYDKTAIHAGDTVKVTITLHIANEDVETVTGTEINSHTELKTALDTLCENTYNIKVTAIPTV